MLAAADWTALHDNLRRVISFFLYHRTPVFGDAFWATMLGTQRQIGRGRACEGLVDADPGGAGRDRRGVDSGRGDSGGVEGGLSPGVEANAVLLKVRDVEDESEAAAAVAAAGGGGGGSVGSGRNVSAAAAATAAAARLSPRRRQRRGRPPARAARRMSVESEK